MTYQLSPTTREVLRQLRERERRQRLTFREIEQEQPATRLLEAFRRAYFDREEPAT